MQIPSISRFWRRTVFLATLFAGYAMFLFTPAAATLQQLQAGMDAPDFSLPLLSGEKKSFADLKGDKLTVLVVWSTWDRKSGQLLARMEQLYQKYHDKGLTVIAINADGAKEPEAAMVQIRSRIDSLGLTCPVLLDNNLEFFHDIGIIALPTTVIVDKERVIKYELSGYPLVGAEEMADFVITAIEGAKPAIARKKGYQPAKVALRLYNMGKNTLRSGRMADSAEMWFKKAIEADPDFVLPRISLGKFYLQRGDRTGAAAQFREALAKEPNQVIALCESALMLFEDNHLTEGQALLENVFRLDEAYTPCYYYAALGLGRQNKPDQALKMFDEAEKINPLDYNLYVFKGRFYEEQKKKNEAVAAYRKAMETILRIH